uniref:GNAT family N-acetyltransferase n=1 Tax=Coleofasciculus sp. FACHB-125 TaxID=2692784 RepID=UPI0030DD7950
MRLDCNNSNKIIPRRSRSHSTIFKFRIDEEIELKLLEVRHAQEVYALVDSCRTSLREWLPWVDGSKSPEDTKFFIEAALKQFAANNGFHAGIWYQGKMAGAIGCHEIDWENRATSIGYWLGENFPGCGIMIKSCRTLVNHTLVELKLNRVEIRAAVENSKSRAIPEKLGFTNEGTLRQACWLYDHFVDLVVYGMLARDWQRLAPQ